jgi:small multidrug resistance pump
VVATTALKAADGFRVPGPTLLVLVGYTAAFFLLSLTLRTIPVGIAYAIWSGIGQVLVMVLAWIIYRQSLDIPALLGITLILAGVLVLAIFSDSMPH